MDGTETGAGFGGHPGMRAQADSMETAFVLHAMARLYLAQGHNDEASALALQVAGHSLLCGRLRLVAKAQIVHALARFACGDEPSAIAAIGQALAISAPEKSIRLFVDEGEKMAELLMLCRKRAIYGAYVTQLLAAYRSDPGPIAEDLRPFRPCDQAQEPTLIVEPLSEREQQVLRLMADGQSNSEISLRLDIATSTVKTHVHSIFRKLQATRRTQAIARARTWQII